MEKRRRCGKFGFFLMTADAKITIFLKKAQKRIVKTTKLCFNDKSGRIKRH